MKAKEREREKETKREREREKEEKRVSAALERNQTGCRVSQSSL